MPLPERRLRGRPSGLRQRLDLAQQTPRDNPVRYDILKRLTSVRAAAGEFADADNWLQQASPGARTRSAEGPQDRRRPADLRGPVRGMKDFDRAQVILRRVLSLHVEFYTYLSAMVADDFSRMGSVYAEQENLDAAINSIDAALDIRTKLGGPMDPALIPDWTAWASTAPRCAPTTRRRPRSATRW